MIHLTVGDLIDGNTDHLDTSSHHLYVVRDGDVVFYVGRSQDVISRLLSHMGLGRRGKWSVSSLGALIKDNLPTSHNWAVTLLALSDCGVDPGRYSYRDEDTDFAEVALIRFCKPCLNSAHNPGASALPDRYVNYERRKREHAYMP